MKKAKDVFLLKTCKLLIGYSLLASVINLGCNNSIAMREMAEEFCECANVVVSQGISSYYVMDSCASHFMGYNKYPVFYYSNGGAPPVGKEKISTEEFEELS